MFEKVGAPFFFEYHCRWILPILKVLLFQPRIRLMISCWFSLVLMGTKFFSTPQPVSIKSSSIFFIKRYTILQNFGEELLSRWRRWKGRWWKKKNQSDLWWWQTYYPHKGYSRWPLVHRTVVEQNECAKTSTRSTIAKSGGRYFPFGF